MSNTSRGEKKFNRIYRLPASNLYSHSFLRDFSTGYIYTLSNKSCIEKFFSFEPKSCSVEKMLRAKYDYDISYSITQTIEKAMYSLIAYGKAYIYIKMEYETPSCQQNKQERRKVSSLEIQEIQGFIKKKVDDKILFVSKGLGGGIIESNLESKGLVILDIRNLGFNKNYFKKLIRKLRRYDITSRVLRLSEDEVGYDFSVHARKNKILELKAVKDIGWSFGTEGLSDSYILYKKIQMDTFKIKALRYILNEVNKSLSYVCGEDAGKIVANIRNLDYDKMWNEYQNGEITVTELSNILFSN